MLEKITNRLGLFKGTNSDQKEDLGEFYSILRSHVLKRINEVETGKDPFYHCFIDSIFPDEFYERLRAHMLNFKGSDKMQARTQDNASFVNRRYNLVDCPDTVVRQFRAVFEDNEVKLALLSKFYGEPDKIERQDIKIHKEFEYVFCEPNRFQNIHIDIPPKFMSFVFYIPENEMNDEGEKKNATVLYNKELEPVYGARFRRNSVCIFVPHFYSYHGFSSTMERDVLVMFYIHERIHKEWLRANDRDTPPYDGLLNVVENKLRTYPLLEYGSDIDRIKIERAACRINAPLGRVMVD